MDNWLRASIMHGLSGLLALRLDNAPAADTITKTADIWEQAIGPKVTSEQVDAPRIAAAFQRIFPTVRKWPAPAQVIELMPPRKPLPQLTHELTPEQRRRNQERAREMVRALSEEMTL